MANGLKKKIIFGMLSLLITASIPFSVANALTCATGTVDDGLGVCIPDNTKYNLPDSDVATIVMNVMMWLLGIFAAIGIIGFVISGAQYLLSGGDDKRMQTAKRNMLYCIVGVIVGIAGYVIINAIDQALRGSPVW